MRFDQNPLPLSSTPTLSLFLALNTSLSLPLMSNPKRKRAPGPAPIHKNVIRSPQKAHNFLATRSVTIAAGNQTSVEGRIVDAKPTTTTAPSVETDVDSDLPGVDSEIIKQPAEEAKKTQVSNGR